jgi:hypothetical protein
MLLLDWIDQVTLATDGPLCPRQVLFGKFYCVGDRLLCLRQGVGQQMPHVMHAGPHIEACPYGSLGEVAGQAHGVAEHDLPFADLDERRGQPTNVGEDR